MRMLKWPITLELSSLQPLSIIADVDRIGQVVTNYLYNALNIFTT